MKATATLSCRGPLAGHGAVKKGLTFNMSPPQPGDVVHQPGHPLVTTPPAVHPLSSPLRDAVGPATEPPATSGPPPDADGFTVISVYTRAQAIAKADPITCSGDHRDLVSAPESINFVTTINLQKVARRPEPKGGRVGGSRPRSVSQRPPSSNPDQKTGSAFVFVGGAFGW